MKKLARFWLGIFGAIILADQFLGFFGVVHITPSGLIQQPSERFFEIIPTIVGAILVAIGWFSKVEID